MDFFDAIQRRYSVRAYSNRPVEDDKLQRVLDAARMAPTAANYQPFRLVVIKTAGREAELRRIYRRDWFWQAPLLIAVCSVPAEAWRRRDGKNYADVDATIAMDHLILAAAAEGLGTCWVAAFDPEVARDVLGVPPGVEPLAFTPLGYPEDHPAPKLRKPIGDLVRYEHW